MLEYDIATFAQYQENEFTETIKSHVIAGRSIDKLMIIMEIQPGILDSNM